MMVFYFQIWFYKCYKWVKWVLSIIFNHIPTHIVPNLKVPLENYPCEPKNGHLSMPKPLILDN
jgi:hypothetical protein